MAKTQTQETVVNVKATVEELNRQEAAAKDALFQQAANKVADKATEYEAQIEAEYTAAEHDIQLRREKRDAKIEKLKAERKALVTRIPEGFRISGLSRGRRPGVKGISLKVALQKLLKRHPKSTIDFMVSNVKSFDYDTRDMDKTAIRANICTTLSTNKDLFQSVARGVYSLV